MFESCFQSWKFPYVVTAYKNDGERSDPANCRPISVLPITSEIIESFVNEWIGKYLEGTELFSALQYGFRAFRSTDDLLTVLTVRIYNSLDVGGEIKAIALDKSKAFDNVWNAALLHKLNAYSVLFFPLWNLFFMMFSPQHHVTSSHYYGRFQFRAE